MTTYYVDPNSDSECLGTSTRVGKILLTPNLVTDPSFSNWASASALTNWDKYTEGSSALSEGIGRDGGKCARLTIDSSASNALIREKSGDGSITSGGTFLIYFWARASQALNVNAGYRGVSTHFSTIDLTTEWSRKTIRVIGAAEDGGIEFGRAGFASTWFEIDDVEVYESDLNGAWKSSSNITGLSAGDSVLFKAGEVFRETITIASSGTSGSRTQYGRYGEGHNPVFTKLVDRSAESFELVGNDIYKLAGVITTPLAAPWGVLNGDHAEQNLLTNGSFEDYTTGPDGWTVTTAGGSTVNEETSAAYTGDGGSSSLRLDIDVSNNAASVSQAIILAEGTDYVFRVVHKETGTAQLAVAIESAVDGKFWNFSTASFGVAQSSKTLAAKETYSESWLYFRTPAGAGTQNYELSLSNGGDSSSQSIFIDQCVVIERSLLNANFRVATSMEYDTAGFGSLVTRFDGLSAESLNPGEWFWEDNDFYYRLATGESIDGLHIEVQEGTWAASSTGVNVSGNYNIVEDIEIAFMGKYGFQFSSTAENNIARRILAHDLAMSFLPGAANNILHHSASYNTEEHSYYITASGSKVHNCSQYYTKSDSGYTVYSGLTGVEIKGCIASEADWTEFGTSTLPGSGLTASNNLWNGTVGAAWESTDSIANQNPLYKNTDFSAPIDLHLLPTSPAIGAGVDLGYTTDIEGNQLYPPYNIGAYGGVAENMRSASLQHRGRVKYSLLPDNSWPSAPEIIERTGVDNAVYNADGTGKTFATDALALAAMATLADDQYLFAGTKAAALYSVDMSEQAAKIKEIVGD